MEMTTVIFFEIEGGSKIGLGSHFQDPHYTPYPNAEPQCTW